MTSKTEAHCAELVDRWATGAEAAYAVADLRDEAEASAAAAGCQATFGRIDGLLAVAGAAADVSETANRYPDWRCLDQTIALNARSQALVGAVLRAMLAQAPDAQGLRGRLLGPRPSVLDDHARALFDPCLRGLEGRGQRPHDDRGGVLRPARDRVTGLAPAITDTPMAARAAGGSRLRSTPPSRRKQPLADGCLDPVHVAASSPSSSLSGRRLLASLG